MTLNKTQRIAITVGAGAVGALMGVVLTQHGTRRERVLTAVLAGTAGVGLAQTAMNLASMEG